MNGRHTKMTKANQTTLGSRTRYPISDSATKAARHPRPETGLQAPRSSMQITQESIILHMKNC
jgi:hypothetical protein